MTLRLPNEQDPHAAKILIVITAHVYTASLPISIFTPPKYERMFATAMATAYNNPHVVTVHYAQTGHMLQLASANSPCETVSSTVFVGFLTLTHVYKILALFQ